MAVISLEYAKTLLQISGTTKDLLIEMLIPIVEDNIKEYCNDDFLDDSTPPVEAWPAGMKLSAAQMIGYSMSIMSGGGNSIGMESESQGEYSYTRETPAGSAGVGEYPASVLASLNKWRKSRIHFGSVREQSRDRRGLTLPQLAADKYVPGVDGGPYEDNAVRPVI